MISSNLSINYVLVMTHINYKVRKSIYILCVCGDKWKIYNYLFSYFVAVFF